MKRKRTGIITLVFIASAYLTACENTSTYPRNIYRNRSDCINDWGDAKLCEPDSGNSYGSGYYRGPYYYNSAGRIYYYRTPSSKPEPISLNAGIAKSGQSFRSVGKVSGKVSRGGFGSFGRGSSGSKGS